MQLGDKHCRHPVQHGAALLVYRSQCYQRIKLLHHHLRTAESKAAHGRQHHAEAMKQRHTGATFVFRRELHVYPREVAVVGNIVVGEHHPFREARRAGGVLHVHHIVTRAERPQSFELVIRHILSQQKDLCCVVHPPVFLLTNVNHILELREDFRFHLPPLCCFQFRQQLIDDVGIVASCHPVCHAERMHVGILHQVAQLLRAVTRVHRHRHCPYFGRRIEKRKPVRYILCPDTHICAPCHSNGNQTLCHMVHALVELLPGKAKVAVRINNILLVRRFFGPVLQPITQCSVGKNRFRIVCHL